MSALMSPRSALIAILLFCAPASGSARAAIDGQTPSGDAAPQASKALLLAQLVEPRETLADPVLLEARFVQGLLADPKIKSLEADYPGAVQAMWRSAGPEALRQTLETLPAYWESLAAIYAANMSAEEIAAASAFFSSDVGRKAVKLKNETMITEAMKVAGESGTDVLTKEMFGNASDEAANTVISALTQNEQLLTAAFGLSPAGQRMLALASEVQDAAVKWLNETDADSAARIEALMVAGLEAHIKALDAN